MQGTGRRAAPVGVVSLVALVSCALLLLAAGGAVGVPAALTKLVAALACGTQAVLMWRRWATDDVERDVRVAFTGAVGVIGASLAVQSLLDLLIESGRLDSALRGVGVVLGGIAFCTFLYRGLVHWNQFRAPDSDPGDWLNGASAVLLGIAGGEVLLPILHAPMTHWSPAHELIWLGNTVTLLVLTGTAATVALLGGLTRDLRVHLTTAALAGATVTSIAVALLADVQEAGATAQVCWVAVAMALGVCSLFGPAPVRPPRATSQSPVIGALFVLGSSVLVLAFGTLLGQSNLVTVGAALAAALGSGSRLSYLIASLADLAETQEEARTDHLTGLANRRALSAALVAARVRDGGAALLIVDLDRFKDINDQYGHAVGDEVLQSVAVRLRGVMPPGGLVGRLGGDEFAVILPGGSLDEATRLATTVVELCAQPLVTSSGRMRTHASVGVAAAVPGLDRDQEQPEPGSRSLSPGELLRRADAALYDAKRSGGGVRVFDREADLRVHAERRLLAQLRELLNPDHDGRAGEIVVHFQPQLATGTRAVVGAEALVRWQHPEHGLLPPVRFVELAQRHGLMDQLTACILAQAVAEAARWERAGHDVQLAVNISASCLVSPDLIPMVEAALSTSGIAVGHLKLEVTETTLMSDPALALQATRRLADRGVAISIDDYGTGYSSLSYLHDLQADEVKLDRTFISRLAHDERTAAIVAGTIDLAHGLGLCVVAEGVEEEQTLELLGRLGCDTSQGFLHARPMPAEQFLAWLGEHSEGLASDRESDGLKPAV